MLTAILVFCSLLTFGILFGTYISQATYKKGMIFAVTLPKEAAKHDDIKRIQAIFKKQMMNISILFVVSLIPFFFLRETFQVAYFILWIFVLVVASVIPFRHAHRDTLALKRKYDWFIGEQKHVQQDSQALSDDTTIYSDDDEYWGNGFTYHNPHDRRVFVQKRIGIGMTVNTGTTAGKWFIGVTIGFAVALLMWVLYLAINSEFSPPVLSIREGQRIEIDYVMYDVEFPKESIIDLALVEDLPSGIKTNGEATSEVARGHFRLDELGKSRLYVYKNNPPYIRIQLEDEYIFYNEKEPSETKQVYEQLQQMLQ